MFYVLRMFAGVPASLSAFAVAFAGVPASLSAFAVGCLRTPANLAGGVCGRRGFAAQGFAAQGFAAQGFALGYGPPGLQPGRVQGSAL